MPFKSFLGAIIDGGTGQVNDSETVIKQNPFYIKIVEWIKNFDSCPEPLCHVIPTAFIYDYKKSHIVYISSSIKHLTGIDKADFLDNSGIVRFIDLIHPNDFKIYNEQIFPNEMAYLAGLPQDDTQNIIFSSTLRVKEADGAFKILLMKKCFIINEENKIPTYEFGIFTDISSIKKDLSINHTIERFHESNDTSSFLKVATADYFPEMDAGLLSAREREILVNLSLGIKRKDVGTKLFISDNTVANHIKAILRKTNSKNIREAIAICKMNGII